MKSIPGFSCTICGASIGKDDAQFVDEETFSYLAQPPAGLAVGSYCSACFEAQVAPAYEAYMEKVEQAKNVNLFYASQGKESRFVRRIEKPIKVENCKDRDEAIMRLAFLAVSSGKNALVDVDLSSEKVRNGGWQSSNWKGRAIPADISEQQLQRRFPGTPN